MRVTDFRTGVVLCRSGKCAKVTTFCRKPRKAPRRSAPLQSRAVTKAS
nr:MAG TPA: Poxvirus C4/C10 protein [Caudoviricetes sp.]